MSPAADPRAACIIGVARQTWHPADAPDGCARAARHVGGAGPGRGGRRRRARRGARPRSRASTSSSLQSWQYDDAVGAPGANGWAPSPARLTLLGHRRLGPPGAGRRGGRADEGRPPRPRPDRRRGGAGHRPPAEEGRARSRSGRSGRPSSRPFPMDLQFDPSEISHAVFEAYLTFALFDNARRAHLRRGLDEHRAAAGSGAGSDDRRWRPPARTPGSRSPARPRRDHDRHAGQPDGGLPLHEADDLHHGRRHVGGRCCWRARRRPTRSACPRTSGSTCAAAATPRTPPTWPTTPTCGAPRPWPPPRRPALAGAGIGIDDVAHFDLYSCFASLGELRARCARHRRGRPSRRDPDRRAALPRRPRFQLHDALASPPWPRRCGPTPAPTA